MLPVNWIVLSSFVGLFAESAGQVIVSKSPAQVIQGIGASGAWWPNDLYNYPEAVRENVAELLFESSGVGLTSYRYNVGGGGVFVGNPVRAPQTFYVSPGVYNWSADAAGVYFLKRAAASKVPILTAFVNSAPPAFTSNNRSCGGTIVDAQIPAYAQYLADVISHWKGEGVEFTHVSPMNEPDDGFNSDNVTPCGQEGMIVTPSQRAAVVNALRTALDAANLTSVGIMADESSSTGNLIPEAPTWMPDAASSLAAVSHHQYGFANDATVAQMGSLSRNLTGKETWFTEICCFATANAADDGNPGAPLTYAQIFEPTIVGGLQLGQLIHQGFTQTLDAHFDFWTALSSGIGCSPLGNSTCTTTANLNGWNDGLLYYDPGYASNSNFALYKTKRFFVLKHFTTFIPPGSTRFDIVSGLPDNVFGLAFTLPKFSTINGGATLILMNMGSTSSEVNVSQVGLGGGLKEVIQTSAADDWKEISASKEQKSLTVPTLSITSILFS